MEGSGVRTPFIGQPVMQPAGPDRRLVILCLHGFRQNATQFKGRLAGLQKKLSSIAVLKFIDAPYVLPLWYKQQQEPSQLLQSRQSCSPANTHQAPTSQAIVELQQPPQTNPGPPSPQQQLGQSPAGVPSPKRAWLLSPELLEAQPQLQELFAHSARCRMQQEQQQHQTGQGSVVQDVQHHKCPVQQQTVNGDMDRAWPARPLEAQQPGPPCKQQQHHQHQLHLWQPAPADLTTLDQHTTQCCGWQRSWQVIQQVLQSGEQIDGILGFSQGAAVAAVVCALLQEQQQQQLETQQGLNTVHEVPGPQRTTSVSTYPGSSSSPQQQPASLAGMSESAPAAGTTSIKFVIFASGFVSPAPEHQQLLSKQTPIRLPSLHIYAAGEGSSDRQIQQQLSEGLFQLFDPSTRQQLVHTAGHLIPCNREVVDQIKGFLQRFASKMA